MEKKNSRLQTIWYFLRPYKRRLGLLLVLCLLIGYLESIQVAVLYPILTASLDMSAGLGDNFFISILNSVSALIPVENVLIGSCIIFILLTVFVFLCRYIYTSLSAKTTARVTVDYKERAFAKSARSDYQFFVDSRQGDTFFKIKGAPESVAAVMDGLTKSVVEVLVVLSLLTLIISISWKATLLVVFGGIAYYYFARHMSFRIAYVAGQEQKVYSQEENVVLNEYISGIKQVITTRTAEPWLKRFNDAVRHRFAAWTRNKIWTEVPPYLMETMLYAGVAAVVIGILIFYADSFMIMIPMFGTFAFAMFRLFPRVSSASRQLMRIMNNMPNLELTRETLEDKTYTRIRNGTQPFSELQTGIEFSHAGFTHPRKNSVSIEDVSITIGRNRMTAIVGPSGAGKSTLVNLLLRLFDVDSGAVLIDGTDIKEYDMDSFLARVGVVSQETFIYNAPVRDNIVFGGDYSREEVIEAARLANAHDFIEQLPQGYDTVVGDQGMRLSGGERQRIAIARAMIRKPQILVLDEATSSLDNVSESIVQQAIDKISEGCTTLVVAHRLSTIRRADTIYVIDKGRIVESGTHAGLMRQKGQYSRLYSTQQETGSN